MIIHNMEQWTPEWFEVRKFKMTASNANTISVNWKGLDTYIKEIVSEGLSTWEKEHYSNKHTERWNELEEFAREMYELETGNTVSEVWFIEYNKYVWCSPDWLVWEDWGIEIKCLMDVKHFSHVIWEEKIDKSHMAQIQMCLMITGRKWWDYVLYNPNYEKSLIIHRVERDEDFIKKIEVGLKYWEEKIIELINIYNATH